MKDEHSKSKQILYQVQAISLMLDLHTKSSVIQDGTVPRIFQAVTMSFARQVVTICTTLVALFVQPVLSVL